MPSWNGCSLRELKRSQIRLVGPPYIHYGRGHDGGRRVARGLAREHFSRELGGQGWLAARLRDVTGIDAVVPEKRPDTDASVMAQIDNAIGSQSTERLSLRWRPEGLVLETWPAELKKQAEATYRTGRGQLILDFAADMPAGWRVRPNGHRLPVRGHPAAGLPHRQS